MNQTQASRLLTLAWFLKTEVPACQFNLNAFVRGDYRKLGECGTQACALGWCPVVFPQDWGFDVFGLPYLGNSDPFSERVARYFGLSDTEMTYLFALNDMCNEVPNRTPKQEAREIEKVVAKHDYTYAEYAA